MDQDMERTRKLSALHKECQINKLPRSIKKVRRCRIANIVGWKLSL